MLKATHLIGFGAGRSRATVGDTFDSGTASANGTLSNGNLTYVVAGSGAAGVARTISSKSSGKFYAEFRLDAVYTSSNDSQSIGICTSSQNMAWQLGQVGTESWSMLVRDGIAYTNGVAGGTGGAVWNTVGKIGQVFVDLDNNAIWFGIDDTITNGATKAEMAAGTLTNACFTGLTGTYFLAVSCRSGSQFTMRTSSSSWTYSPPSGFGVWTP